MVVLLPVPYLDETIIFSSVQNMKHNKVSGSFFFKCDLSLFYRVNAVTGDPSLIACQKSLGATAGNPSRKYASVEGN